MNYSIGLPQPPYVLRHIYADHRPICRARRVELLRLDPRAPLSSATCPLCVASNPDAADRVRLYDDD